VKNLKWRKLLVILVLLGPAMTMFIGLTIYPFIKNLIWSTTFFVLYKPASQYISAGLENYKDILFGIEFWNSVESSLVIVFGALAIECFIGLGIALVLNERFRGRGILRTLFIIPMGVMPIVAGVVWKLMLFPGGSLISDILVKMRLASGQLDFWGDVGLARLSVMAADIWGWTPFVGLILLAGLQAIPSELYDAAQVDGASQLQRFTHVTAPLLKYAIIVALMFRGMDLLRLFDTVYIMTQGGPGYATEVISFFIYRKGFSEFGVGYAAATSVMVFVVIFVIAQITVRKSGIAA
jgi:multiple sugar transport system permease protein